MNWLGLVRRADKEDFMLGRGGQHGPGPTWRALHIRLIFGQHMEGAGQAGRLRAVCGSRLGQKIVIRADSDQAVRPTI